MSPRVLALLLDAAGAPACLEAVSGACRALPDPEILGLHVRCDPASAIMPSEEVLTTARRAALEAEADRAQAAIRAAWQAWSQGGVHATWREEAGDPAAVARAAGAFALIAMSLPGPDALPAQRAALDALLFTPDQPVLVVPAGWSGEFGRHLAVGWRDTEGTRRALVAARPWLRAADRVTLLAVADDGPSWPEDALLGVEPGRLERRRIEPGGQDEADSLLAAVADAGADGLVMGAYRRGRVMEWILGGVTQQCLCAATRPLLMVH